LGFEAETFVDIGLYNTLVSKNNNHDHDASGDRPSNKAV
jgi:hypothetical protein